MKNFYVIGVLRKVFPMPRPTQEPFIFQQDNAPVHTATKSETYLRATGVEILPCPAQSPDLNPVENLWSHMTRQLKKRIFKNIGELREAVHHEWSLIPAVLVQQLYNTMPNRLYQVRRAHGNPIPY